MKLLVDGSTVSLEEESDPFAYLREMDGKFERATLIDERSGVTLEALCVDVTEEGGAYGLSYSIAGEDREFYASPRKGDLPSVDWVVRHFVSFSKFESGWKSYSNWEESSRTKSWLSFLLVLVAFLAFFAFLRLAKQ